MMIARINEIVCDSNSSIIIKPARSWEYSNNFWSVIINKKTGRIYQNGCASSQDCRYLFIIKKDTRLSEKYNKI